MDLRSALARRRGRGLAGFVALLALAAAATQATAGASAPRSAKAAAAAACGTVPAAPAKDPNHLVATLPKSLQKYYEGLPNTIMPSAYTHWKPKHGPPWTIGFLDNPTSNTSNEELLNDVNSWGKKLEAAHLVKKIVSYVDPTFAAPTQIQQFNSLIQQKVDLIIVEPASAPALVPEVIAAHKAGIPVVTTSGIIDSPYALNWTTNPYLNGAEPVAYIAKTYMHGKGNILLVQGAPTQPTSVAGYLGAKASLSRCPGIHIAGTVVGDYENSVAKSVTLQFLSSYSGTINGVYDGGVMSQGELSAFQQLGKPIPAITNLGAVLGTLAYWYQHQSTFGSAATGSGGHEYDRIIMDVAIRLLEGKGPRLNDIVGTGDLVTKDNLNQIARYNKSALDVNNQNIAEVPPFSLLTDKATDGYFTKPGVTGPAGL
jgi:ribose transport system substrate-binding protein